MTEMPKYSPYRPHFMAPGPHVDILKDKPISFDTTQSTEEKNLNEDNDEDFIAYKYYRSDKILGRLFDAIDEQAIFQGVQRNTFQQSRQSYMAFSASVAILQSIWDHVNTRCLSTNWKVYLDRARGIRDE